MSYDARTYWESRLRANFSIAGTGHAGFGLNYNRYIYMLKKRALDKAVFRNGIQVRGKKILDAGCGSGFFIDYYIAAGAAAVTGIDITDVSVDSLRKRFPGSRFIRADISSSEGIFEETFDIINVFDVLYHIVDDRAFRTAVRNMGRWTGRGSYAFITDSLDPAKNSGDHMRYRAIDDYSAALADSNMEILEIAPISNLMGRPIGANIRSGIIRKALGALNESFGWLSYIIDSINCGRDNCNMSLMVCRKR